MNTPYYIVEVKDYGEVYEYEFPDLKKAQHLMSVEQLPCALWECDLHSQKRRLLDSKRSVRKQAV